MPRVSFSRFRGEVLSLYEPPARAKASWFKARQVLDILAALAVQSTADLTPPTVNRFVRHNPAWQPATVRGLLAYLRPICRYAVAMEYLRVDPFAVRKDYYRAPDGPDDAAEPAPRHLSLEGVGTLLGHLEAGSESWRGGRLQALTAAVAYTGLRRNEALFRAVEDFDLAGGLITVRARKGKRLKTRASAQPVPIPDALVPILERWLPRAGSKWAFPNLRGSEPWTGGPPGGRPLDQLKAAGVASGVGKVNFLMLRHTWATHAEVWGLGELMVQRVLRHTSARTQQHYRHADTDDLKAACRTIRFPEPPAAARPGARAL